MAIKISDSTILKNLTQKVISTSMAGSGDASARTRTNYLITTHSNRKFSGNANTCRESVAYSMDGNIKTNGIDKATTYVGFVSLASMAKCIRYFNRLEETFNFKGDPTKQVVQRKIRLSGQQGDINLHVLSINKEWLASPTLYQMALLIIRLMARQVQHLRGIYKGLSSFSKENPFGVFDAGVLSGSYSRSHPYIAHITNVQKYGKVLLAKRAEFFSGTLKKEWTADRVETEYGMGEQYSLSSASGPSSLCMTIKAIEDKYPGNAFYFKFATKKELMRKIFLGGE